MSILFASDIHLSAARPGRVAAFQDFLLGPCRQVQALYLLGDVFDVWLGDDDHREPHPQILTALAHLSASGVAVYFMTGNHDLLMGEECLHASGCQAIHEPYPVEIHGHRAVLLHGDALCTRDEDYQAWRRRFLEPRNQQAFLSLTLEQREAQAARLQLISTTQTALKSANIMDVTPQAVLNVLTDHQATHMIHGHTHRPAIHSLDLNGTPGMRIVLGDWYGEEQILAWDETGLRLGTMAQLHL